MPFLEKYLYVKKSILPDAGKGLFIKKRVAQGSRIVEYKGKLQPWKDVKDEDGYNPFLLQVNSRYAINGINHTKALGRFANDARGFSRVAGKKNNAEFVAEGNRCFIDATRDINRYEEILVDYGKEYWQLLKKIKNLK